MANKKRFQLSLTPLRNLSRICLGLLLSICIVGVKADPTENNPFSLFTDSIMSGSCSSKNIYETAINKGWTYSGFLYTAFLTSTDEYNAVHTDSTMSDSDINTSDLFTLSGCDYSYCMLQNIFGEMPGLFYSSGSPTCSNVNTDTGVPGNIGGAQTVSNLMRIFNIGLFSVVCIVIGYGFFGKGVLIGGFEGDMLQKNFTMMTFTRITVAVGTIVPMPGIGYSAMQVFIMYVVLLGVGFADSTFRTAMYYFLNQGYVFSFSSASTNTDPITDTSYTISNVQSLFNISSSPTGVKYANIMNMMACGYYLVMQDKIESNGESNYDTSIPYDAITSLFSSPQAVTLEEVMSIDTSGGTTTISFGNYSGSNSDNSCGAMSFIGGQLDTNSDTYKVLQTLFNNTGNALYGSKNFFMTANDLASETKDYYQCLQGNNIMYDGLMRGYQAVSGTMKYRPSGVICKYDKSQHDSRVKTIAAYVNQTSPQGISQKIALSPTCSQNCLPGYASSLINQIAANIPNISTSSTFDTIDTYSFANAANSSITDPTGWVIDTGNSQFTKKYISDLLLLTQTYKVMEWALQEISTISGIYTEIINEETDNQTGTGSVSSTINESSLNLLTQSMLAPFFGDNAVTFISFPGKILTWRNLAVSANNLTTSMMMILQRLVGAYYYPSGKTLNKDWYVSQTQNDSPSINTGCKTTYRSNCMGTQVDQCYSAMSDAGCLMNGKGLLGSIAVMYNASSDDTSVQNYNPIGDYVDIGRTILTASTYYLFENNKAIFALYAELTGVAIAAEAPLLAAGMAAQLTTSRYIPPWCNRACRNLMSTVIEEVPRMFLNVFVNIDQDRIDFYSNIGSAFMFIFVPYGAVLAILLPLYPTIIFIVGIFGWLISVVEALISGPMVAIGLCHPEGSDFLGKAEMGIGILFQTFLRPVLIVFGVFFSVSIINLSFLAFNIAYATQYANIAGGNDTTLGSAIGDFHSNWQAVLAVILALAMIYAYTAWQILSFCCIKMISMSNAILSWVSSGSDSNFTETIDIMAETKSKLEGDAGAIAAKADISKAVNRLGGEFVEGGVSTVRAARDEVNRAANMTDEERRKGNFWGNRFNRGFKEGMKKTFRETKASVKGLFGARANFNKALNIAKSKPSTPYKPGAKDNGRYERFTSKVNEERKQIAEQALNNHNRNPSRKTAMELRRLGFNVTPQRINLGAGVSIPHPYKIQTVRMDNLNINRVPISSARLHQINKETKTPPPEPPVSPPVAPGPPVVPPPVPPPDPDESDL